MRHGQLCKECKRGQCIDEPTPDCPIDLECPSCGEKGCEECDEKGRLTVTSCPLRAVPLHLFRSLDLAQIYRRGLPPIAGGALDQSAWFVDLCQFAWSEAARIRAEAGMMDDE